jgi:polysaccharide export outer membrane protein
MKVKTLALVSLLTLVATSCSTKRSPLPYFEDAADGSQFIQAQVPTLPTIQPDDELYIMVTSEVPAYTANYNLPLSNPGAADLMLGTSTPQQKTFIVDSKGDIDFPVLGKLHVAGLNVETVRDMLVEKISADAQNPLVYVQLINFKVYVAGEVKTPGVQRVTTSRYSVLDALTSAGDMTEFGERNNVLLIRQEDGKSVTHRLNLNSSDLLSSPYFYLKQGDYVYVQPNKIRQDNSKYNQNNAFKVTVISTIVSACSVIASLTIALTD